MKRKDEIAVQRHLTRSLIQTEPISIALWRPAPKVSDGAGGVVRSGPDTLQPEAERFFSDVKSDERYYSRSDIGQAVVTEHVLIGPQNDDIREDDYWDMNGRRYKVEYVHPKRSYQTKARVVSYANP